MYHSHILSIYTYIVIYIYSDLERDRFSLNSGYAQGTQGVPVLCVSSGAPLCMSCVGVLGHAMLHLP